MIVSTMTARGLADAQPYTSKRYHLNNRLEASTFIQHLTRSPLTLQMFISCVRHCKTKLISDVAACEPLSSFSTKTTRSTSRSFSLHSRASGLSSTCSRQLPSPTSAGCLHGKASWTRYQLRSSR